MAVVFGPSFYDELRAAGLDNVQMAWHPESGDIIGWDDLDEATQDALAVVIGAHDPTMPAAPQTPLSMRQFWMAMALPPYSIITGTEALAAIKRTALPAVVNEVLAAIPDATARLMAEGKLYGATEVRYDDELTPLFAAKVNWSSRQTIEFFNHAATV